MQKKPKKQKKLQTDRPLTQTTSINQMRTVMHYKHVKQH